MSQDRPEDPISRKRAVYRLPGMETVAVVRDLPFRETEAGLRTMDLYGSPGVRPATPLPAVVIVAGYPDPGVERFLGCKFKEVGSTVSWAQLIAASGMVAIAYENREPREDLEALLDYLQAHSATLGIDAGRIALWANSGNVPLALAALMRPEAAFACAALLYGVTLDLGGSTGVADMARQFGFANPGSGRPVSDLARGTPLFLARSGQDRFPGLNEALDRFLAAAVAENLPVRFVNHTPAPHAFDLLDDSETSREIIREVLRFLGFHLGAKPAAGPLGPREETR